MELSLEGITPDKRGKVRFHKFMMEDRSFTLEMGSR